MPTTKLLENEIESRLGGLPLWSVDPEGKLLRRLQFASFVEAFGFLTQVAIVSEAANHHAEIFNVYNRVELKLATHDAGGLTVLDFELAARIDSIAAGMGF
jgi:4a-hydroxytetrahydrobiopterin dehydratase